MSGSRAGQWLYTVAGLVALGGGIAAAVAKTRDDALLGYAGLGAAGVALGTMWLAGRADARRDATLGDEPQHDRVGE